MQHTNHFLYTRKLFSRYNRIATLSYVAVIVTSIFFFSKELYNAKNLVFQNYKGVFVKKIKHLERCITSIENAVLLIKYSGKYEELNKKTEIHNPLLQTNQKTKAYNPLLQYIKVSDDKTYFHLDSIKNKLKSSMTGNLTGESVWPNEDILDEVNMALNLNASFYIISRQMKQNFQMDNLYISYISLKGFMNSYPWVRSSERRYHRSILSRLPFFQDATSYKKMPCYWSDVYLQRRINQFMISFSTPFYLDGKLLGVLSAEIPTSFFCSFLNRIEFRVGKGSFVLLTNEGHFIASEIKGFRFIGCGDSHFLSNLNIDIGKIIQPHKEQTTKSVSGEISNFSTEKYTIFSAKIPQAPWTLCYIIENNVMDAVYSSENYIVFAILLLTIFMAIVHVLIRIEFITPARQLVHHIENESQGRADKLPQIIAKAWRPWFETITNVFAENHRLIHDLEMHIQNLDEKVQHRTKELARKNHQLEKTMENLHMAQEQIILQEKLASLGSLTAGIAHEMKNPLNFVINFSEISQDVLEDLKAILHHTQTTGKKRLREILHDLSNNLRFIHDHGQRADNIIRRMLVHSRKCSDEKILTDLNHMLSESVALALSGKIPQENHPNIRIINKFDPHLPRIKVIPEDLGRVFINLISNASYALAEKISTTKSGTPSITLSTSVLTEEDVIVIEIRDNGIGIPKKLCRKIFEPFYTTKPFGKGTGLGLSLSYDIIVQQHQGMISVESEVGAYTCFTITLPLSDNKQDKDVINADVTF